MALTIRSLSGRAENSLDRVIEMNEGINTKTKAVEFVLEQYFVIFDRLEQEKKQSKILQSEVFEHRIELQKIADGFEVLAKIQKKYKK